MDPKHFDRSETVSPREAAEILGVSHTTIHNYFDLGYLDGYRLPGGARRVSLDSVIRLRKEAHRRPHKGRPRRSY